MKYTPSIYFIEKKERKKKWNPIHGGFYKNCQVEGTLGASEFSRIYWRSTRGVVFDGDDRNEYVNAGGAQE